jgi:hypothetical protein
VTTSYSSQGILVTVLVMHEENSLEVREADKLSNVQFLDHRMRSFVNLAQTTIQSTKKSLMLKVCL